VSLKGEAARAKVAAVKAIGEILSALPARVSVEEVLAEAEELARYERDLVRARADWKRYNAERGDGEPELGWRQYLAFAKRHGEWRWPIPPS
jgi:hypothetical protein